MMESVRGRGSEEGWESRSLQFLIASRAIGRVDDTECEVE
jgi:hypothetical protein